MPTTDAEQYLLELINDARLDPLGDAFRYLSSLTPAASSDPEVAAAVAYFGVDGPAFAQALASLAPAQPVASSEVLLATARAHDAGMIGAGLQAHQVPGEADFGTRLSDAGYRYTSAGENIYAYATGALDAHAGFMIDWGAGPDGMQNPAGHRTNILDPDYREVGVGIVADGVSGSPVGPDAVTEDFGTRGPAGAIVLGVAYDDTDGDGFYSIGEGRGGLAVAVAGSETVSSASGGYALQTSATGLETVTLSGADLAAPVTVRTDLEDGLNAKLDIVDGHILHTSVSAAVSGGVDTIVGLGTTGLWLMGGTGSQAIVGTSGDDTIAGGPGNDVLTGGAGADTFVFHPYGGQDEITDFTAASAGHDKLDLSAFPGLSSLADLLHHTTMVDGHAEIVLDHARIVLDDVTKRALAAHPGDVAFQG